ncbi:hypothetical protein PUN28_011661 [Cardiocondyla obscurior]|uniref:Kinesin motor domain-containing protein n=2 Tax=Cardiocondyla obscurior TaxID=286306 RepID=A0AAW2FIP6_9HYME
MASNTSENAKSKRDSETSSPPIEMYLKIKPSSNDENNYMIVNPETLVTFVPFEKKCIPRLRDEKSSKTESEQHVFTKIFESQTSQTEFINHRVTELLGGKNSTIMTYGMKNSGKTYTLFDSSNNYGLISNAIAKLFSTIKCTEVPWYKPTFQGTVLHLNYTARTLEKACREKIYKLQNTRNCFRSECDYQNYIDKTYSDYYEKRYSVWLSCIKIYNENTFDPLYMTKKKIYGPNIYVNSKEQAFVHNLNKIYATTKKDAEEIIKEIKSKIMFKTEEFGNSLSHIVFTIELLQYEKDQCPEEVTLSSLTFYDLASFINYEKKEYVHNMCAINNSLLAFNMCLRALSRNQKAPFRQSQITRLCQHALLGKENLSIIINVVFEPNRFKEVQRILNFCDIIRKLNNRKNKVENTQVNSKIKVLRKVVKRLKNEKRTILYEKNDCTFELTLAKQELEKFRQLVQDEICKWGGNSENIEDTTDCLMNNLLQLMCGKVKDTEKKFKEVNEKLHKMSEMEEECSYNRLHIIMLQRQIEKQKKQLIEVKQYLDHSKNESISDKEHKDNRSINISVDDNAIDNFLPNNMSIGESSSPACRISPTVNRREADGWVVVPNDDLN